MPASDIIYENDNYAVATVRDKTIAIEGNEFVGGYLIYNKETGIEEFFTPCLPEALRIAVHWDIALTQENHLWPYKSLGEDSSDASGPGLGELLQ